MKSAEAGAPEAKPVMGPCPIARTTRISPFWFTGVMDGALLNDETLLAAPSATTADCARTPEVAAPVMSHNAIVVFELMFVRGTVTRSVESVVGF